MDDHFRKHVQDLCFDHGSNIPSSRKSCDFYREGDRFECQLKHRIECLKYFMIFFRHSSQIPGLHIFYNSPFVRST
jgi:hypothetical protein